MNKQNKYRYKPTETWSNRGNFTLDSSQLDIWISVGKSGLIPKPIFSIKFSNRSGRIFLSDLLRANIFEGEARYYTCTPPQVVKLDYTNRSAFAAHIGRKREFSSCLRAPALRAQRYSPLAISFRVIRQRFDARVQDSFSRYREEGGTVWM